MKHFGDITKLSGRDLPPVNVICGGSPCQDLSVAGKRAGLKHSDFGDEETTRSGLFMEQIRIIKESREHARRVGWSDQSVRYGIWENVPGALSSGTPKGEDFRIVLEEFAKVKEPDAVIPRPEKWENSGCIMGNGWSLTWRIVDAQFWGTPQRRRRIALLCDFDGWTAPDILFDPQLWGETEGGEPDKTVPDSGEKSRSQVQSVSESLPGNSEPGGEARQGTADGVEGGVSSTITASYGTKWNGNAGAYNGGNFVIGDAISFQERAGKPGGGKGILIQHEHVGALSTLDNQRVLDTGEQTAYGISAFDSNAMKSDNPHSGIYKADTSRTLDLNGGSPACNQGGVAIVCPIEGNGSRASHFGNGYGEPGDPSFTLNTIERHGVAAYGIDQQGGKGGANYTEDIAPTLAADSHGTPHGVAYGIDHVITTGGNCTAQGPCVYEEIEATLKAAGPHSVAYGFTNRGYESGDVGETLRAGSHGAIPMVSFSQNQRDEVRDLNDVSGAIAAEPGTHQQTYVIQGNVIDRDAKQDGSGINTDVSYTLNSVDRHGVFCDVYNQVITGDIATTLTAACGGTNTSGPKVIAGFKAGQSKDGGLGYAEEQAPTLSATPSALEPTLLSYGDE